VNHETSKLIFSGSICLKFFLAFQNKFKIELSLKYFLFVEELITAHLSTLKNINKERLLPLYLLIVYSIKIINLKKNQSENFIN